MKSKSIHSGLMLIALIYAIAVPARAQTANMQQTLNQYVSDLQSNPNDTALRGKIIALAQSMRPVPAIPEEARGHYVMATTFAEKAKGDTERAKDSSDLKLASAGFERAVTEYKAALLAAPWWADAYKKLAIAQKAAGQYDDAIASLNLYLLTQPSDARDAQDEIYKLKALKQSAADDQANQARRQQEEQQRAYESSPEAIAAKKRQTEQDFIRGLDGVRFVLRVEYSNGSGIQALEIHGNTITMKALITSCTDSVCQYQNTGEWRKAFEADLIGREFTHGAGCLAGGRVEPRDLTGRISDDGYSVTLENCSGTETYRRER
jgi:tetratricopeptide (TPR) repeat protein